MKKIITYGTFDMLHIGHINLLTRAKYRGDYLIVGVTSDDYDRSRGKLNVVQSQEERIKAVSELDIVDEVIIETHKNQKQEDIKKYHIDEFVIGDDWDGYFDYLKEFTEVIYLPRTQGISSTKIRNESVADINFGVVNVEHHSKRFVNELGFVNFTKVTSVYDKNIEANYNELNLLSKAQKFNDYEAFLKSNIDAVYVCGDIASRYQLVKKALLSGKSVLCENPITIRDKELEELFEIAKEKNLLLLWALKTAFAPAFNKLLEEIKKGLIGEIKDIRATFTTLYKQRGFGDEYVKNGATNLLMSYPSLLVNKLAKKHLSVDFFDQRVDGYDVSNVAITRHANQVLGIASVGVEVKSDGNAIISGTEGYAYIPAPWWLTKEFHIRFEDPSKEIKFEFEFAGEGLRYMIAEFVSLVRQKRIESSRLTIDEMIELNKIIVAYNKRKNQSTTNI